MYPPAQRQAAEVSDEEARRHGLLEVCQHLRSFPFGLSYYLFLFMLFSCLCSFSFYLY